MITRLIFWAIVAYILYRFVFNFLIPILIAGSKIRAQLKNMREQVNGFNNPSTNESSSTIRKEEQSEKAGEYIDFEEIK